MARRRVARVAERIREEASEIILYQLQDPRIQFVTVTKVDLSNDLRYATVYVSVLGDETKQRTALRGLNSARGFIQSRIGDSLQLRETPNITFQYDPSIATAVEVSRVIDEALAEIEPEPTDEASATSDGDSASPPPAEEASEGPPESS